MAEQWDYYVAYIIQSEVGMVGFGAKPVRIDVRIQSFESVGALIEELQRSLFPDGLPDLPDGMQPVVPLFWHLLTAKRRTVDPPPKAH